ncbi:exosome complex protein Rrp42 [Candidatus Woesearchaeota archaeon]|nr:exosome complex protein Rrp42 [Candidatus Woesearchaeota archaeon]
MKDEQKQHVQKALQENLRYDGRKKDQFRAVTIEYNISKSAEGSARVKIGDTEVIAGVKMSVETPYPDTPDEGSLMVNAELLPLSSPRFEPGPPSAEGIEVARVVDRGIREAGAIDVKKLCIARAEKVWIVTIDICTINDAGNLIDASSLAAIAALKQATFPKYENNEIDYQTRTDTKLPMRKWPLAITVFKIGNQLFVDPLREEEDVMEARLTVSTTEDGKICALQKGGSTPLTPDEIDQMIVLAQKFGDEQRSKL